MQISSIQNNHLNFKASFEEFGFASLDDKDLKRLAYNKAVGDVNDKKHRKIDNALYYSLPVVAGVSSLAHDISGLLLPTTKVRGVKLARAGVVAGIWGTAIGALSLLSAGEALLTKKVKSVRDFVNDHPVAAFVGHFAAAIGTVYATGKFGSKLLNKFSGNIIKNIMQVNNFDKVLNNNKILNMAENLITKLPSSIKDIGKTALKWAPAVVMATQIGHYFGHDLKKSKQAEKNYEELKIAQNIIRQDILDEIIDNSTAQA